MPAETEKEWTKRDLRHTSAVVICPPTSTWEPIQRIRAVNDKSYTRWMPHINLLYPFLLDDGEEGDGNFDRAAAKAREALRDIEPFTVSLRTFGHFAHAKSCTVWLHPSGDGAEDMEDANAASDSLPPVSDGVMATQAALERAFPFANDLSTISPAGFTPHLSVGQYDDKETASEALERDECDVGADDVRGGRGVHHIPRGSRRAVRVQGEGAARGVRGGVRGRRVEARGWRRRRDGLVDGGLLAAAAAGGRAVPEAEAEAEVEG